MKSKLIKVGAVVAVAAPVLAIISCSSKESASFISQSFMADLQKHEFKNIDQTYTLDQLKANGTIYDAEMKHWIDGDTPTVTNISPEIKKKAEANIRINSIDTPELHVSDGKGHINVLTTGKEFEYADKARLFGLSQIPVGSKIKLMSDGEFSYERIVGSLFYQADPTKDPDAGDTKYISYSARIVKEGLCLPFANVKSIGTPNIVDMVAPELADSYNWAIKHKKGMFAEEVNNIIGVHGATDDSAWRWRSERPEDTSANAYDLIEIYKSL